MTDIPPQKNNFRSWSPLRILTASVLLAGVLVSGCIKQIDADVQAHNVSLEKNQLETHGIAFITPSSVTGQEEDRQSLALIFADTMARKRSNIPILTLSETIGSVNRNGLAADYKAMFEEYHFTGIFKRETLEKIGQMTGSRYLAQLKLANFVQSSRSRLSFLGLRIFQTNSGNVRLFLSIWDSWDGSIVWEGMEEVNFAYDTAKEKPISFKKVVEEAAERLVARLP